MAHQNDFLGNGHNGSVEWYIDELRHSPQVSSQADVLAGVTAFTLSP